MDPAAATSIAAAAVSLLVPYLNKAGESLAAAVGKSAWEKTKQIYELIRAKLAPHPGASSVLTALEKSPEDADAQAALRFHMKAAIDADEQLGNQLAALLKEADDANADTVFGTTIHGDVHKLVQIGVVRGDVNA